MSPESDVISISPSILYLWLMRVPLSCSLTKIFVSPNDHQISYWSKRYLLPFTATIELRKAADMLSFVVERGTLTEISPSCRGSSTETQWMKHWVKTTASYLYNVVFPEKVSPTRPYYLLDCCHHHPLIYFSTRSIFALSFSIDKHLLQDRCLSM